MAEISFTLILDIQIFSRILVSSNFSLKVFDCLKGHHVNQLHAKFTNKNSRNPVTSIGQSKQKYFKPVRYYFLH